MHFILDMEPPSVTHQDQAIRIVKTGGRMIPMVYDTTRLKEARRAFMWLLREHIPPAPMEGPLMLTVAFYHSVNKSHKPGEWKTTKPDTDNMIKLLKDCMTKTGFWKDDSQVVLESVSKRWASEGYIEVEVMQL